VGVRRLLTVLLVVASFAGCGSSGERLQASSATLAPRFRVLVFTKATRYVHASIPVAVAAIRRLGRAHRFAVDATADERWFTDARLSRYDALVFVSTTGVPIARLAHRRALERYIAHGGGFLGVHAVSAARYSRSWPWFIGLVGASFRKHPPGLHPATVVVTDRRSAATRMLPRRWHRVDEWYAFTSNPRGRVHVLATLDERSYHPHGAASMGADHPIAWCRRYAGGRSVYTAMGHPSAAYRDPRFAAHLLGAIEMAAGAARFDCSAG